MDFKPFNLAEAVTAGQSAALNRSKLDEIAHSLSARAGLRDAVSSGTPEAMELYRKAFPEQHQAYQSKQQTLDAGKLKNAVDQVEFIGQLLSGVNDEASFQDARNRYKSAGFPVDDIPANFDPNWTQQKLQQAISVKDKLTLLAKQHGLQLDAAHKERSAVETERHHRAQEENSARLATAAEAKAKGKEKPPTPKPPARGMVLDVADLIKSDAELSELADEDIKALSYNVASRAQSLLQNKTVEDASEAMAQALEEERANVTPREKKEFLGVDFLARDKKPAYSDRRKTDRRKPPEATGAIGSEPTAVNPKTGERIVFRDGKWQPVK